MAEFNFYVAVSSSPLTCQQVGWHDNTLAGFFNLHHAEGFAESLQDGRNYVLIFDGNNHFRTLKTFPPKKP